MRDTFARDSLLLILLFGMGCIVLAIALSWSRGNERSAYTRGYAAAVDSVRASVPQPIFAVRVQSPMIDESADTLVWMWGADSLPVRAWVPKRVLR